MGATESFGSFLFDARTRTAVNKFGCEERDIGPKTSCAFSSSGRLMFVGTDDGVEVWDTLQGDASKPLQFLKPHGAGWPLWPSQSRASASPARRGTSRRRC